MEENILLQVKKPGQYIGEEWNISRKSFDGAKVTFALCFPDLYEVGMSNLGVRIIYQAVNDTEGLVCERFFSPDTDMEAFIRSGARHLRSLESKKALRAFDVVGFSLGHELQYANVLALLDMADIPLAASQRDASFPLVIGGGPCVLNPEPLHEFFDCFLIGEAEDAIVEILRLYEAHKAEVISGALPKAALLKLLAKIEGVYVPSLYREGYREDGTLASFEPVEEGVPLKVRKRFVQDLNTAVFPTRWLVPYVQIIHDRITLEVMRGCPNRCRFCQARVHYYPFRQRKVQEVLRLAEATYCASGYDEISLSGLSVSEYYALKDLMESLIAVCRPKSVSVSLPSIKPKIILEELSALIASVKKTGLTFAPEAATAKLREILGKDFDMEEFLAVLEKAYAAGYQRVKLYFMIGLPQEELSDLEEIVALACRVSSLRKPTGRGAAQVTVSINTLIPKPHTPFQWLAMGGLEETAARQEYLKKKIAALGSKGRKLKVDFHAKETGYLEAVFSRGDRRLSGVILNAFRKGARFDSWSNRFNFSLWKEAFAESGVDPDFYLRQRSDDELLPWDFLDMGVSKEALLQEAKAARAG